MQKIIKEEYVEPNSGLSKLKPVPRYRIKRDGWIPLTYKVEDAFISVLMKLREDKNPRRPYCKETLEKVNEKLATPINISTFEKQLRIINKSREKEGRPILKHAYPKSLSENSVTLVCETYYKTYKCYPTIETCAEILDQVLDFKVDVNKLRQFINKDSDLREKINRKTKLELLKESVLEFYNQLNPETLISTSNFISRLKTEFNEDMSELYLIAINELRKEGKTPNVVNDRDFNKLKARELILRLDPTLTNKEVISILEAGSIRASQATISRWRNSIYTDL